MKFLMSNVNHYNSFWLNDTIWWLKSLHIFHCNLCFVSFYLLLEILVLSLNIDISYFLSNLDLDRKWKKRKRVDLKNCYPRYISLFLPRCKSQFTFVNWNGRERKMKRFQFLFSFKIELTRLSIGLSAFASTNVYLDGINLNIHIIFIVNIVVHLSIMLPILLYSDIIYIVWTKLLVNLLLRQHPVLKCLYHIVKIKYLWNIEKFHYFARVRNYI